MEYKVKIIISNLLCHDHQQKIATFITTVATNIWLENCTFLQNSIVHILEFQPMIEFSMFMFQSKVTFLNCTFNHNNDYDPLISVTATKGSQVKSCGDTATVILQECSFVDNKSPIIFVDGSTNTSYPLNFYIVGSSYIHHNYYDRQMIKATEVNLKLVGPVLFTFNTATSILFCSYCKTIFSKDITIASNECNKPILYLLSESSFLKVIEYTNIIFTNNTYSDRLISIQSINYEKPILFCGFQYMPFSNRSLAVIAHFNITISNNFCRNDGLFPEDKCRLDLHHITTHCKWIPTSAFHAQNPGVINQQIIHSDQHQLGHHTNICYCSHNVTNCSVDVLGPVYPGQVLQVGLCILNSNEDSILMQRLTIHNYHLQPARLLTRLSWLTLSQTIRKLSTSPLSQRLKKPVNWF